MRSAVLSSVLFALLTTASVAVSAAPAAQSAPMPSMSVSAAATPAETSTKINLNTADAETLQKELSGIGSAKANAIVAYREANGEFATVDELLEVKGIGKAILDKNRDKVGIN
ncbi:helix-hairpin-helix domain-containing protein [Pseudomonas sp. CCI3.2]|uniref:ComEA family DNA-binding protein n=1 Tax=unclassified Pseudomonas TaxID=196821 RepID=UPI002AC9B3E9|nr:MULTISPECIES: helix-hairpin-helix domain-containing protein [unclassified Pseudomonas]MEB0075962.1 helix-hairpin-helix domain-containing protein [Pseudomonas sp. MH10out]MEB0101407.1 helix-hairpin-helix domain-containing protein [Pseudomonas sp. CCI3.2]MEB0130941.1 helix-hairpin-helix domain-containing protein [Pseudomonas sp. CCI2.4]MEB0157919.1 helix-hairpin-helix domain-containing protein [Pseudomonas sp. AH2 (2023)]MEB0166376.1 helix-hairpin-helix domain-containing protein [Pseudomonas 